MGFIFKKPPVKTTSLSLESGEVLEFAKPTGFVYREYVRRIAEIFDLKEEVLTEEDINKMSLVEMTEQGELILVHQITACLMHCYPEQTYDEVFNEIKLNAYEELLVGAEPIVHELLQINVEGLGEEEKKPTTPTMNSDTD